MSRTPAAGSTSQGLAFLALLSFVTSFFTARIFTTVNPDIVVVSSGIHFHHFWYGLLMITVAGWLAIVSERPEYERAYALVFGLGLGLLGDETGLLLTFGDYNSELTYVIFVAGISLASMAIIAYRYWPQLGNELVRLGRGEKTAQLGTGIAAMSSLAFAFGHFTTGLVVLTIGFAIVAVGIWLHRARTPVPTAVDVGESPHSRSVHE